MKRFQQTQPVFSLLLGFLFFCPVYGQSFTATPTRDAITIHVQSLSTGHLRIQFTDPSIQFEQITANNRNWTRVSLDGESYGTLPGQPMTPVVARPIRLPDRGTVAVRILHSTYTDYPNLDVFPTQAIPDNPTDNVSFTWDEYSYSQDRWYPEAVTNLGEAALLRDVRIAMLAFYPVQVNPVTRTVRVYESLEVETVPLGGHGENELLHPAGSTPSFAAFYREVLGCEELATDAIASPPGTLLVISRNDAAVQQWVRLWSDWKTASGRPCVFQSYGPTVSVTSAQVIAGIQQVYNTAEPPLEGIIIFGDDGTTGNAAIPASSTGYGATDHNYTTLAGDDILGDVYLGRFSFESLSQLATMVTRSINYEKTPVMSDTNWYTSAWGFAGTGHSQPEVRNTIRFCLDQLFQHGLRHQFYDEHSGQVSMALVQQRLNPGLIHWTHIPSWIGEIQDVGNLNNGNKSFFAMNLSESTGNWSGSTGLNEVLIRLGTPNTPNGAIAALGTATSGVHWQFENTLAAGAYFGFGALNLHQPGPMTWMGKFQLWRNHSILDLTQVENHTRWNNLMGDPTALLWSGVPRTITTTIPDTIGLAQNRLEVIFRSNNLPAADLLVTAWKRNENGDDETYCRTRTDSSGCALLDLANISTGLLFVTAIGDQADANIYPFHDTIAVVLWSGDVGLQDYALFDDTQGGRIGNNDSTANPGETVDLNIRLVNRGVLAAVAGITGTLSSTDPRVTVLQGNRSWNTLQPGASGYGSGMFRVQVLPGIMDNETIPLQLRLVMTDTSFNRLVTIPVTIRSIDVTGVSLATQNANGNSIPFVPGGTVYISTTVNNLGGLATGACNAKLFTDSHYLTVIDSIAAFPSMPIGSDVSNIGAERFELASNAATIPGSQHIVGIAFTDGNVIDTVYFPITVGVLTANDPTGPDAYGYYAYDNTDVAYEMCPQYNWIEIRTNGLGVRLPLNDNVESADTSLHIPLPFSVQYYGHVFDSALVCSNGWLAFGTHSRNGLPLYKNYRNTALPTSNGPANMVCPFWDNLLTGSPSGVWVYHDTTAHKFIVTWFALVFQNNSVNEFQVVIYDEDFWPTFSNDDMLLFQYKQFNNVAGDSDDPDYATIGISDGARTSGIQYTFMNAYTPGSSTIANSNQAERAILFTSTHNYLSGSIAGRVTRLSDGAPVADVTVQVLSGGRIATTNANGEYALNEVLIGNYNVIATKTGYNDTTLAVHVGEDSTSILNFVMRSPGLSYVVSGGDSAAAGRIYCRVMERNDSASAQILMRNTGNGVLNWNAELRYDLTTDEVDTTWQEIYSFPASLISGDYVLQGVEFDGRYFWVTGSNNASDPNKIYKFDREGNLLLMFNQTDITSTLGYRDLAWDGHYLYGSTNRLIDKLDTLGNVVGSYETNVNPARALACDTINGLLYYADFTSPIYALRLSDGVTVQSLPNLNQVFGLAWYPSDPDSCPLYALARVADNVGTKVVKINPSSGMTFDVITLSTTDVAYGATVTANWNPIIWSFVALTRNPTTNANRVTLYELDYNTDWIWYSPALGSIMPGDSVIVRVGLNSQLLAPRQTYRANLTFQTNLAQSSFTVPIGMYVMPLGYVGEGTETLPTLFALESVYPNPFNAQTTIQIALPRASAVTLILYDQLGREAARLLQRAPTGAGRQAIRFDGSSLSSGVYFLRMTAGEYSATRKIVLLK